MVTLTAGMGFCCASFMLPNITAPWLGAGLSSRFNAFLLRLSVRMASLEIVS